MVTRMMVVVMLLVSLTACSGGGAAPTTAPAASATTTPTTAPTTAPSPSRPAAATPVGSPTVPLPAGCDEAAMRRVVHDFIVAFNAGDQAGLARVFPAKGSDGDHPWTGDPNQLRWFTLVRANLSKGVDILNLYTPETLLAYFAERHAQHERMRMVELVVNRGASGPGMAAINFRIARAADDLPESVFSGKGGVSCQHGVIFLWSQGGVPFAVATPATPAIPAATLDPPPAGCGGPRPQQVAPYFGPAVGASPFWAFAFGGGEATLAVGLGGELAQVTRTDHGWAVKVLMALEPQQGDPVTVRVTDAAGTTPVWIEVNGRQPSTSIILDPREPEIPVQHGAWKEYRSYWYIATAGCYTLTIAGPGGATRVPFAAGR